MRKHETLAIAASWLVIGYESTFWVVFWLPITGVIIYLATGVVFHLATALVMGLNNFFVTFVATYSAVAWFAVYAHIALHWP